MRVALVKKKSEKMLLYSLLSLISNALYLLRFYDSVVAFLQSKRPNAELIFKGYSTQSGRRIGYQDTVL